MAVSDERGVVYIGRIPPGLAPAQIRSLLGRFAPVDRVYLAPSKHGSHGGRIRFTEGWIEFVKKGDAKRTAALLNGQPMGGKKGVRQAHSQDLWCLRYLSGFQWVHLSERIASERAVRDQRLRTEIAQARRENALFMDQVQRSTRQHPEQGEQPADATHGQFDQLKERFRQRRVVLK